MTDSTSTRLPVRLAAKSIPAFLLAGCVASQIGAALAQTPAAPSEPGFTTNLFAGSRSSLLGDVFGLRTTLGNYGMSLGLQETSEVLGNVTGGTGRGVAYDGLTLMSLGLDTAKAFGWDGGTFNISAFQIHGRNLSADNLGNIQTVSGIEAQRSTRLWELWYQHALFEGKLDVKIGQQSLDQEFITSAGASTFINTMMGWPVVPSYDLYAGGPAYPLSSLGVRVRGQPARGVSILAGVFDDNPPGGSFNTDSQVRGAEQSGTKFHVGTGALFIAEVQYAVNQPTEGDLVRTDAPASGLPGVYKIGAWFDTAGFPDQRTDNTGLSLNDPDSTGTGLTRRRNFSIYAVADQTVWQGDTTAVSVFTRLMGAPGDRNLVSFGANAGMVVKAPFAGRDNDAFGIGLGVARVGRNVNTLDRDTGYFTGPAVRRTSTETFVEVIYQYQLAPWWSLQPDAQYIFQPGGGAANPRNPTRRLGNEAVLGLRTNIVF